MNNEAVLESESKIDNTEQPLGDEIKPADVPVDLNKSDNVGDKDLNENSELGEVGVRENETLSTETNQEVKMEENVSQERSQETKPIETLTDFPAKEQPKEKSVDDTPTLESGTLEQVENYETNPDVSQTAPEKITHTDVEEEPTEVVGVDLDQNSSESGSSIERIENEIKNDEDNDSLENPVKKAIEINNQSDEYKERDESLPNSTISLEETVKEESDEKEMEEAGITVIDSEESEKDQPLVNEVVENETKEKSIEDLPEVPDIPINEEIWRNMSHAEISKKIIKAGSGDPPLSGSSVVVNLEMYEEESDKLIQKLSNFEFVIGDKDAYQSLELILSKMLVGEEAEISTTMNDIFSDKNQMSSQLNIKLKVQLLLNKGFPNYGNMTAKERYSIGNAKREKGNALYSKNRYRESILCYTKALMILNASSKSQDDNSDLQALVEMKLKCYSNLAAAQLKIQDYEAAEQACASALLIQPNNVKVLYRKAKAIMEKGAGDLDTAAKLMKKALQIDPNEKAIQNELQKLTSRIAKQNKSQKEIYQRMFNGKESVSNKNEKSYNRTWMWLTGAVAGALISLFVYKRLH